MKKYSFELPAELIASEPAEPRDSAKLFVYDTASDTVTFDIFANLSKYVPTDSFLVFNDTKVLPARVELFKETGGKVEVLFLVNEYQGEPALKGLSDRKLVVGQKVSVKGEYSFVVSDQKENIFYFKPEFPIAKLPEFFTEFGQTPIPRYLGASKLPEAVLRERYQSVFARNPASVAAPTASLHFTDGVFKSLEEKKIGRAFVTLHVGPGTFAPLKVENFTSGKLHEEFFEINKENGDAIVAAKQAGKRVIPVGTTALRTLESSARGMMGKTDIFIHPPFDFKIADGLITNFHIPESSLMCLVDAFLQFKNAQRSILDLYTIAIENKFRFYSFGDAMLIL